MNRKSEQFMMEFFLLRHLHVSLRLSDKIACSTLVVSPHVRVVLYMVCVVDEIRTVLLGLSL